MIDPLTILFGLGFAGLKYYKAASGESSVVVGEGGPLMQVLDQVLGHIAATSSHQDVEHAREKLMEWFEGTHPDKNMDLERAVARSATKAHLFCLRDAKQRTRNQQLFDHSQLDVIYSQCEERLKQLEHEFEFEVDIDPLKLIGVNREHYDQELVAQAITEIERNQPPRPEGNRPPLPPEVRDIFNERWFGYLCRSFWHEIKHNQPVANIYEAISISKLHEELIDIRVVLEVIKESLTSDGVSKPAGIATNLPYAQPTYFMGREQAITDVEDAFKQHPVVALVGMRGVGKSTVAVTYADRHRHDYRAAWWIRADTKEELCTDLVQLGVRLGWVRADEEVRTDEKEHNSARTVLKRLAETSDKILLIYDNAMSADDIYPNLPRLPRSGSVHVIITSTDSVWANVAEPIKIVIWPNQVGADYLLSRLSHTASQNNRADAEALSDRLGGLPLALEVAAAYCESEDIPVGKFRRLFEEKGLELFGPAFSPPEFHERQTVHAAFSLAIEEAAKLHPAVELLMEHLSLLAPGPIPLFLFEEGRESFGEPLGPLLVRDGRDTPFRALRRFALVERESIPDERNPAILTSSIRLHRLVREIAASRCAGVSQNLLISNLIRAVGAVYPDDDYLNLLTNWPRARRLDALAFALVGDGVPIPPGCELAASDLMEKVAGYQQACTPAFAQVRALLRRAQEIREETLGPGHPNVASILNKLALLEFVLGNLSLAQKLCEQGLAIREKTSLQNDPALGDSHLNMARILSKQNQIVAARNHCEKALLIFEGVFGRIHPQVATSLVILGHLNEDDLSLAQRRFEEAQRIYEERVGPDSPVCATNLLNLAGVAERKDDLDSARRAIERSLDIFQRALGPDHRLVAYTLSRLATVLQIQGEITTARLSLQSALAINQKWFGPHDPECMSLRTRIESLE